MSTKCQVKPKNAVIPQKKQNQGEKEIIEIKDIPTTKQVKAKENTENSSSEATTPNKKRQNKKKKDSELIEIMDIEIPDGEFSFGKKKSSAPPPKQNKTPNKEIENEKPKKKGKSSIKSTKSVAKLTAKDKSPINRRKKEGKVTSITLEESDEDEEIKEVNSFKKKNNSKTPHKKITLEGNEKSQNNRNKKVEKKKKKNEKEKEIIQCELSSEESEKEDSKGKLKKKRKNKKNSKNSGYLTSRKMSVNSMKSMDEKENIKSKSTIKVSRRDEDMKEKINTLLGRKRKADNKNQKSKTPIHRNNKNRNPKEKAPEKNKEGKVKSKTPDKKEQKKTDKNNKLNIPKMEIDDDQNSKEIISTPELAILNQLTNEYGLEKVIDTICKPKLNQKNKLDSCIQGLKNSCAKEKLPFLLIKMLYSYFDSKYDDNNRNIPKRATSAKKSNIMKNLNENLKLENSTKLPIKGKKSESGTSKMENDEVRNPILTDNEEILEIPEEKSNKNNVCQEKSKSNKKSPLKEEKHKEKRIMSIGSHYNKSNGGEIYKYQVLNLDGKGNAIFKCYDERCNGMGIYELDSKKFSVAKNHNLKHAEHEYIKNLDKDADSVFNNLTINEKCDAQVFKENGERTVNIY